MSDEIRGAMRTPIPVIDLFAGPGGLNEGFSSMGEEDGDPIFQTVGSFEMEPNAVATLTLRSVFRHLKRNGGVPESYYKYISGSKSWEDFKEEPRVAAALEVATAHVHEIELSEATREDVAQKIKGALAAASNNSDGDWVLIGGPPCQAYSLAGRSRRTNDKQFAFDKKHFLYEEYLDIIKQFAPALFVMENVKGLLSSTNHGVGMFGQILHDLQHPSSSLTYEVRSLVIDRKSGTLSPKDFVIPAEDYGIPQKRHRVILLGVRSDVVERTNRAVLEPSSRVTVKDAIADLPFLRSKISPKRHDSQENWDTLRKRALGRRDQRSAEVASASADSGPDQVGQQVQEDGRRAAVIRYRKWIEDDALVSPLQHESRSHMESDIERYAHLAWKAEELGKSPKFADLPEGLEPNHKNIGGDNTPFLDRFRVQVWNEPSTTIVSHISKDGHYYIHPDECQMRSLTVREAARLQTFPDNYFFEGSRTMQFHQVGNAVPPLLARLIAEKVVETLRLDGTEDVSED